MKRINIYMFLALVIGFTACTSIEVDPTLDNDLYQPDVTNIDDVESLLNAAYSGLKQEGAYTGLLMAEGEWPADNLKISPDNTGQGALDHEWDYEESSTNFEDIWTSLYQVNRRANFVIFNAASFSAEEPVRAAAINSEALVVRSLVLYELAKTFGANYSTGEELAVPIVLDPNDIAQQQPRATYNELFTMLRNDLATAIAGLSNTFNPNKASKALAHGILARISLMEGDWNGAVASASSAIAAAPDLATLENYNMMFGENDEDGESIFKIALNPDDIKLNDPYYAEGVGARFDPSGDLVDLVDTADVRYAANFQEINEVLSIFKYRGPESNRGLHEPFVMRTSEMYLIRAEANASLDNDVAALADLDAIRSNRIRGYTSLGESGNALDEAVRVERRIELAYEGFRMSDLRRWGLDVVRTDCTSDECELLRSNTKFVFPIPRAEIFANDNMEQNPGY